MASSTVEVCRSATWVTITGAVGSDGSGNSRRLPGAISVDCFTKVDPADARSTLDAWAEQWAPVPEPVRGQFEQELYPLIRTATSLYQLTGFGKAEQHEWGEVVGLSGFHEFVAIDRTVGALALVVASDD